MDSVDALCTRLTTIPIINPSDLLLTQVEVWMPFLVNAVTLLRIRALLVLPSGCHLLFVLSVPVFACHGVALTLCVPVPSRQLSCRTVHTLADAFNLILPMVGRSDRHNLDLAVLTTLVSRVRSFTG